MTYPDYPDSFPFLPEKTENGRKYGNSMTGLLCSLIEQKDLFEGRNGTFITKDECTSTVAAGQSPQDSSLRSVQDGSQALSRNSSATRFQATPNEYGAKMDGVTDDTAAFQDALNALADGGVLDISAGTALLSAPLTVKNKSCTIHGAGPFATILRWTSGNGIACSESRTKPQTNGDPTSWQITGIRFETASADSGTALSLCYEHSGRVTPSVIVRDCSFQPWKAGFWTKSILIDNGHLGQITGCYFRGGRREGKTTSHHIHLTGNSTTFMIENCHGMISRYGILAEGVTEGVTISKCFFVKNAYGYALNVGGEPMFDISQSHAASHVHPLWIKNGRSSAITGNMCVLRKYDDFSNLRDDSNPPAIVVLEGKTTKNIVVIGCTLNMNDQSLAGKDGEVLGIDIRNGNGVIISHNFIQHNSSFISGIRVSQFAENVSTKDNISEKK